MLDKIVEQAKQVISVISFLNSFVICVTKINSILFHQTRHAFRDYNHSVMHVEYHMWSVNHYDSKKLQFLFK